MPERTQVARFGGNALRFVRLSIFSAIETTAAAQAAHGKLLGNVRAGEIEPKTPREDKTRPANYQFRWRKSFSLSSQSS